MLRLRQSIRFLWLTRTPGPQISVMGSLARCMNLTSWERLMLVGLVAGIAIDMATGAFFEDEPTTTEWGFYIGLPLFGLGLAWAGYEVWKGSRQTVASA